MEDFSDLALPAPGYKAEDDYSDLQYPAVSNSKTPGPEFNPSFLDKLGPNVLAGLAQMGHAIINAPHNIISSKIPKMQDYDYAKALKLPEAATLSDKIVRGLAQYSPAFALPVADMGIAGEAAGLLPRMAASAAPQAIFGATQDERSPVEGAIGGAIGGAAGPLIGKLINALRPSRLFRGNLSKEDLASNLEATQGTNTSLGRVIESPTLNRIYENVLPHIIGSGAEDTMQKNAQLIADQGENILENIRGDIDPGNYGIQLQKALKKAAKEAAEEKEAGFKELNEKADEAGISIGRANFQSKAQEILDEINQSPELLGEFDKGVYSDLKRYASNPEGNNLKGSNIFRGKIGDKSHEFYMTPGKSYESNIYLKLKDALSKDIKQSMEGSENKEIRDLYKQNQENYIKKYAPFEDRDIVKFTRQGGDPDMLLPHFLRGGKNDRSVILTKLSSKLEGQKKQLPLYAYLSKAIDEKGNINPVTFHSLYNKLGKNQKELLVSDPETRKLLDNYTNLVGKNKEAFNLMFNPKTGARVTDAILKGTQAIAGYSAGGVHGLLASLIGGALLGKITNKTLSSPTVRDKLIKAMLENKEFKLPESAAAIGRGAASTAITPMVMELNQFKGYE